MLRDNEDGEYAPEPLFDALHEQRLKDAAAKAIVAAAGMNALAAAGGDAIETALRYARARFASQVTGGGGGYATGGTMHVTGPGGGGGGSSNISYGSNGAAGSGASGGASGGAGGGGGAGSGVLPRGWSFAYNSGPYPEPCYPASESEPEVAPGWVTGYRWWTLPAPDWTTYPAYAEETWPHGLLHGMQGDWHPGVNNAQCLPGGIMRPVSAHPAVWPGCYCGFWGKWRPEQNPAIKSSDVAVSVFGVIKGWGRFRHGPAEFRVSKARILALHPTFTLLPYAKAPAVLPPANYPGRLPPGWHQVAMSRQYLPGTRPRRLPDGREVMLPDTVTDAQVALAFSLSEAWMAVVSDRLAVDYGVPVYETRDLLLSKFPADPVYGQPGCPGCRQPAPLPYGHELTCAGLIR